jgi:TATA-box binding protein (TBP) (component of TFIID and TFIIIB)
MKSKTRVENILCLIDLKQQLSIEEKEVESHGFKPMTNLNGFIFSPAFKNSPKITFMIFPSEGKVFLIGVKNSKEIEHSFWFLIRKLKEIFPPLRIRPDTEIEIQNVLATANLRDYISSNCDDNESFEVNLEKLALEKNAEYDPKKFPGVFLRFFSSPRDETRVPMLGTAVVFRSGKILVGDVKSLEDADLILEKVIEKVK